MALAEEFRKDLFPQLLPKLQTRIPAMNAKAKPNNVWLALTKPYGMVIKQDQSHCEICFQESNKAESTRMLNKVRDSLPEEYKQTLRWEDDPKKKRTKIMTQPIEISYSNKESWPELIDQLINDMQELIRQTQKYI